MTSLAIDADSFSGANLFVKSRRAQANSQASLSVGGAEIMLERSSASLKRGGRTYLWRRCAKT